MCILLVIAMSSIALAAEDPVWPESPRNNVRTSTCIHLSHEIFYVNMILQCLFDFYLTCLLIFTSPFVGGLFKGIADIINGRVTLVWEEGLNP